MKWYFGISNCNLQLASVHNWDPELELLRASVTSNRLAVYCIAIYFMTLGVALYKVQRLSPCFWKNKRAIVLLPPIENMHLCHCNVVTGCHSPCLRGKYIWVHVSLEPFRCINCFSAEGKVKCKQKVTRLGFNPLLFLYHILFWCIEAIWLCIKYK